MVSVIRCWKAEYQKCKHSILLYMHSLIPIMCAAVLRDIIIYPVGNRRPKSVPIWKYWPLHFRS